MADPNLMSGQQTEAWFKQFAEKSGILHQPQYSLKEVVKLLDSQLPIRLNNARRNLYAEYPEGNEWIDTILQRKSEPNISPEIKAKFTSYLLDLTLATDSLVNLKDSQGKDILVAVDVTNNPHSQAEKLNRIRGLPEAKDREGQNRNQNIGSVRTTLGIEKHLVVTLNQDKRLLPSYDRLLSDLNAFAQSPSRTQAIDLHNVPEQDRFINQKAPEPPKLIWSRYNQNLKIKEPAARIGAMASQAFLDGLDHQTSTAVLLVDPLFQGMKTQPAKAQKMASQTIDRVWAQMDLKINKVLKFARKKASQKGASVGKDQVFESKNYIIRQSGISVSIKAKDDRGILLSGGDQKYTLSGFSRNDLQRFETWAQRSKEKPHRSRESRDMDFER